MNRLRRNIAIVLTAATTAGVLRTPAQAQDAAPPATGAADRTDAANQDIALLVGTLVDPAAPQPQRDEAARRLASRETAESNRALQAALVDQNVGGQIAAARALAEDPTPDPTFINPLFAAMGANRTLTEDAAAALSNYKNNSEVLTRFLDLATSRQRGSEMVRVAAIHALSGFTEKRSADALVRLLRNPDESVAVRYRAADALAGLTGIGDFGQDTRVWEQWWDTASRRSDTDFRNDLLERKAAQHDRDQFHLGRLTNELQTMVRDFYRMTPAPQREAVLLRFLRSTEPETRAAAVEQVGFDFGDARTIPTAVQEQVRSMIGDSSPVVRRSVAVVIRTMNDTAALDALLNQLGHENDPAARSAIAAALGPIGDVKAAPTLLQLLSDNSQSVSRSAAQSLRELGAKLRDQQPALAMRVANALRDMIERTANSPADADLRVSAVAALVPLRQHDLIKLFYRLLDPRLETASVRIFALRALGEIGDRDTGDTIVSALSDPDPTVVVAAVQALGQVSASPDQLNTLRPLLDPNNPNVRDPSIREESWKVLQSSLPTLTKEQLTQWADFFRTDAFRQIFVLKTLAEQLTAAKSLDELATVQQQIATGYMRLTPPDPESAVPYFKSAIDYRTSTVGGGNVATLDLIESYMRALLLSGKYVEAISFAAERIEKDPGKQQSMGSAIVAQVDELVAGDTPDSLQKARALVDLAKKMTKPLATRYLDRLEQQSIAIDKRLSELNRPAGNGPRSASGSLTLDTNGGMVII